MTPRLILAPTVELVARTVPDEAAIERWLGDTQWTAGGTGTPAERVVEGAARGCYWSYGAGRGTPAYFENILGREHLSVLEHASFTFAIRGVSRSLTHELVRHRHSSPSQLSQRYCDQADEEIGLGLVVPELMLPLMEEWEAWRARRATNFIGASRVFDDWRCQNEAAIREYARLRDYLLSAGHDRKDAHDAARSLLPEACETRLWLSGNARAWYEAAEKRTHPSAAPEIRRLFRAILALLTPEMPLVFGRLAGEGGEG